MAWHLDVYTEGGLTPVSTRGPYSTREIAETAANILRDLIANRGWTQRVELAQRN